MICATLIVKNEEQVIRRCLDSVVNFVDEFVVIDTGSTDDTQRIVAEYFERLPEGKRGFLGQDSWVSFSHNRQRLMAQAKRWSGAEWLLLLDADMTVDWVHPIPELNSADAYKVLVKNGDLEYRLPLLVKRSKQWQFVGVVHESLECRGTAHIEDADPIVVTHHGDGGARRASDQDQKALLAEYERDPSNPRTVFYLAQTERELGHSEAAATLYKQRATMGGFEEEAWYSQFRLGEIQAQQEGSFDGLLLAYQRRPQRAEPLVVAAYHARIKDQHHLAYMFASAAADIKYPSQDMLFVDRSTYRWRATFELSLAVGNLGHISSCLEYCRELLEDSRLPADIREYVERNEQWCLEQMKGAA